MASVFFNYFLEQFNFWLWMLIAVIIFLTLANNKGWKKAYFLVIIIGFLVLGKLINDWFVSTALIAGWLLIFNLDFFVSKAVLFSAMIALVFLGVSSPLFYLIVFVLWIIIMWFFISSTFSAFYSEQTTKKK